MSKATRKPAVKASPSDRYASIDLMTLSPVEARFVGMAVEMRDRAARGYPDAEPLIDAEAAGAEFGTHDRLGGGFHDLRYSTEKALIGNIIRVVHQGDELDMHMRKYQTCGVIVGGTLYLATLDPNDDTGVYGEELDPEPSCWMMRLYTVDLANIRVMEGRS